MPGYTHFCHFCHSWSEESSSTHHSLGSFSSTEDLINRGKLSSRIFPLHNADYCWSHFLLLFSYCSVMSDSLWPHRLACQIHLSSIISQSLLKFMSIESVMPSNHLILCRPLLLLPSIFPSISVFSNESVLRIGWPKYWSFSFSPSNEYSRLISFRIDWFDFLLVWNYFSHLPES